MQEPAHLRGDYSRNIHLRTQTTYGDSKSTQIMRLAYGSKLSRAADSAQHGSPWRKKRTRDGTVTFHEESIALR
jgi:hypothetical protein